MCPVRNGLEPSFGKFSLTTFRDSAPSSVVQRTRTTAASTAIAAKAAAADFLCRNHFIHTNLRLLRTATNHHRVQEPLNRASRSDVILFERFSQLEVVAKNRLQ